jgi:D-alanyl-D-alanine carboxypeptidase
MFTRGERSAVCDICSPGPANAGITHLDHSWKHGPWSRRRSEVVAVIYCRWQRGVENHRLDGMGAPMRVVNHMGRCRGRWLGSLILVGVLAASACGSSGDSAAPGSTDNAPLDAPTQAKLEQIVRQFQDTNHTPGVLVGIWSPKGIFVSATGVADIATGAPLSPDMQFKIASQTKTFTANLILQLVGEGKVALADHISKWVPGVPNGDQITIRQLLNHTSGLADGFTSPTIQAKVLTGCTVDELLSAEALFPPVAPPGTTWSYSNYGYNLLGRVVELASGQDLGTALQQRIAGPLGLHRTLLPTSGSGLSVPFTHGYGTGDVGPTQAPTASDDATDLSGSCLWAHGGMVSTLSDMRVWSRALATGALLKPEVWAEANKDMIPFVFSGNYNGPGMWRYGLGFVETGGFVGGEGSFAGYESATMYSPTRETSIAVVSTKNPNAITPPPMFQALAMAVYGTDIGFGLTPEQALAPTFTGGPG